MLPAATVRSWQLDQLRKDLEIVKRILNSASREEMTGYRDGGTGWTALEILCHLWDYEDIFLQRASLTVEEEVPPLPNPDPDAWAREHHYNEQDLQTTYDGWVQRREAFLAYLGGLDENAWQRVGEHPRRGKMTVQDQLALIAWHDVNHIEQMTRTLTERKQQSAR